MCLWNMNSLGGKIQTPTFSMMAMDKVTISHLGAFKRASLVGYAYQICKSISLTVQSYSGSKAVVIHFRIKLASVSLCLMM